MQVVYVIHEDGKIKIPFREDDTALLRHLAGLGAGFWDSASRQFVLPGNVPMTFRSAERVLVEISADPAIPIRVDGFFTRPLPVHQAIVLDTESTVKSQEQQNYFSDAWLERLETELHARKYSPRTIKSYRHYNQAFCNFTKKRPEEITGDDVTRYISYLDHQFKFSASTMNMAISALKFFYHQVMNNHAIKEPHRPHADKKLPAVLSREEVQHLLASVENPKHRLLLMFAYSSGLRVSEVVMLRQYDIDLSRRVLHIRSAKGRKDRYVMLSERTLNLFTEFKQRSSPNAWVFSGADAGSHLSIRSAQNIFEQARKKAGIEKPVSIHSLRHLSS
jgi:site-specific recombinase XerD